MRNSPSLAESMNNHNTVRNVASKWTNKNGAKKKLGLELTRTNPVGMFPWSSEVVSKTKQRSSPTRKKKCQNCSIPPGFPWIPQGCPRRLPTAMRMISSLVLQSLITKVEATRSTNLKKRRRENSVSHLFEFLRIHERKILVFFFFGPSGQH